MTSEVIFQPPHIQAHTWMCTFPHGKPGFLGGQWRPWWSSWKDTVWGEGCRLQGSMWGSGNPAPMMWLCWLPQMTMPHSCLVFPDLKAFAVCHPLVTYWSEQHPVTLVTGSHWGCMKGGAQSFHQGAMRTTDLICLLFLDKTAFNTHSEMYWNVMLFRKMSRNAFPVMG